MKEKEEETTGTPEEEKEKTPTFTETLLDAFFEKYIPTQKQTRHTDTKTTIEIMEEMASISDVEKWEINTALQQAGFKTTYIDGAFYWMLQPK